MLNGIINRVEQRDKSGFGELLKAYYKEIGVYKRFEYIYSAIKSNVAFQEILKAMEIRKKMVT